MKLRVGFNCRHLAEGHTRGLGRYTINLLRGLSHRRTVELVLFSNQALPERVTAGLDAENVVVESRRETWWETVTLPAALRRHRIDVFHAPADRGLPVVKTCPCVVTVHDSYERSHWRQLFPTLKQRYWYWKNEFVNRQHADAVLTVSDTTREMLQQLRVARADRIHRIYLAPAAEFSANPSVQDEVVLGRYNIRPPYVLYVGGYDRRKNVAALVTAFKMAQLPLHSLVIVARQPANFARLAEQWSEGLGGRLRLIETTDESLPALYRRASFFVNPSLWESFSFQLVEAMACGTPLLASNRTALPEIAAGAARYVDPTDVQELARGLERMGEDAPLREQLRASGLARVKEFTWQKTAMATQQVYERLVGTPRGCS